jgi:voltage-gated potassium channel
MTPKLPQAQPPSRFPVFTLPRFSAVGLLIALALLLFSSPFVEDLPYGDSIEAALLTLVMVSAVVAVGGTGRILVIALLLVAPALAAKWLHHLRPDLISPLFHIITAIAFFVFVVAHLLRFILRAARVDTNVLCAGLSGYLLLGLLWAPAYVLVARINPGAFVLSAGSDAGATMDGFHAFYFSFITLCTVGYGDVTPVSKVARMLAVAEAIAGLFYVAVLISRLVAIYSSSPPTQAPPAERQ